MEIILLPLFLFIGWKLLTPQQVEDAINSGVASTDEGIANDTVTALTGVPYTPIPNSEPSIISSPVPQYNDGYVNS